MIERIAVIGSSGAGKSVLSRRLGAVLGLPVTHIDALHWKPGWIESSDEEFEPKLREAAAGERWVIDGNFGSKQYIFLPRAQVIVMMDFPRWLCIWRIVKRVQQYNGETRPDLARGCPEQPDWEFMKYVWTFPDKYRPKIIQRLAALDGDRRIVVLRNPVEVEEFVGELTR